MSCSIHFWSPFKPFPSSQNHTATSHCLRYIYITSSPAPNCPAAKGPIPFPGAGLQATPQLVRGYFGYVRQFCPYIPTSFQTPAAVIMSPWRQESASRNWQNPLLAKERRIRRNTSFTNPQLLTRYAQRRCITLAISTILPISLHFFRTLSGESELCAHPHRGAFNSYIFPSRTWAGLFS